MTRNTTADVACPFIYSATDRNGEVLAEFAVKALIDEKELKRLQGKVEGNEKKIDALPSYQLTIRDLIKHIDE